ncbi:50S ribosomal protein L19 [Candidatus Uhrbacteria bacterium]|nr:50S ribosomal protein L19 [Candidatus Uhrbacteria bacterium]
MIKQEAQRTEIKAADIRPGMLIRVHQKIKEINPKGEEKERIQIFEGLVIKHRGGLQQGATITVRKISEGIGVEKIYPLNLPSIAKFELTKQYETKLSKLYHVRHNPKKMKEVALPQTAPATEKVPATA